MLKLNLSPQAVKDLESIYEYSFTRWGFSQAEKYHDELYNYIIEICQNPKIGSFYYFKEGNYRKLNSNRHIIFYRQSNKEIIVIRILHEKMDLNLNL